MVTHIVAVQRLILKVLDQPQDHENISILDSEKKMEVASSDSHSLSNENSLLAED